MLALVTSGLFFGFGNGVYTFVGGVLEQRFHLSVGGSGLILAVFGVTNFVGNMLIPLALRVLVSPRRAVITGLVGMLVSIAMIMLVPAVPLWVIVTMLAVWGLACGFTLPIQQSILADLGGQARGTLLSLGSACMYLGIMVATVFVSIAFDRGGSAGAGVVGILALAVAMLSAARIPEPAVA
jgi:DHA1 family inner membrane transport protein